MLLANGSTSFIATSESDSELLLLELELESDSELDDFLESFFEVVFFVSLSSDSLLELELSESESFFADATDCFRVSTAFVFLGEPESESEEDSELDSPEEETGVDNVRLESLSGAVTLDFSTVGEVAFFFVSFFFLDFEELESLDSSSKPYQHMGR